jgi:hypothetical protein
MAHAAGALNPAAALIFNGVGIGTGSENRASPSFPPSGVGAGPESPPSSWLLVSSEVSLSSSSSSLSREGGEVVVVGLVRVDEEVVVGVAVVMRVDEEVVVGVAVVMRTRVVVASPSSSVSSPDDPPVQVWPLRQQRPLGRQ